MKILLATPAPTDTYIGNAATIHRIRTGLQRRGHLCELFGDSTDGDIKESLEGTIGRFRPDIIHAHDAFRCGTMLLGLRMPWVVSVTGEDIYSDLMDESCGPLISATLQRCTRVLVPDGDSARLLEERVPDCVAKVDVVPRGLETLPTQGTDLRRSLGIPRSRFVILLAGGLRPIKGQHRAMGLVTTLRNNGIDAEMIVVGPEQDPDYATEIRTGIATEDGVRLLPALSRQRMGAAYMDADVVLNTSFDEGMSPVILEAGALGRPVVASDVAGNRSLVRHKETGFLFGDAADLARSVVAIQRNRAAAGAMGVRLREDLTRRFDAGAEIDRLLSAYAAA